MVPVSGELPLVGMCLCYSIRRNYHLFSDQSVYLLLSQSNVLVKYKCDEQDCDPRGSLVLLLCFAESIDEIWQYPSHQDTNISSIGLYQIKQL